MPLTIEELEKGVSCWRDTDWPPDFHNDFYEHELAAVQPHGLFNRDWWDRFVPILSRWRATRPRGRAFLTPRAQDRFEALVDVWAVAIAPNLEADIEGVEWYQLAAFPTLVAEIKDVTSPVFSSKFCHFLAPRIFPVIDNAAMGAPFRTYEAYFTAGRAEWLATRTPTREALVALLTKEVQAQGRPLFTGFPMKCKLIELCMIGRNRMANELRVFAARSRGKKRC